MLADVREDHRSQAAASVDKAAQAAQQTTQKAAGGEQEAAGASAEEVRSEYLCTLQLPEDSELREVFERCRSACRSELGDDGTGLYEPHVSVTGFFQATQSQADGFVDDAAALAKSLSGGDGKAAIIEIRDSVSTDDGHVILDIFAPGVASLARALAVRAGATGMKVRAKAVRHLSLASGRNVAEQQRIDQIYRGIPRGALQMDLVVAKLLQRSDLDDLRSKGKAHIFAEVLRVPLTGGAPTPTPPQPQPTQALRSPLAFPAPATPAPMAPTAASWALFGELQPADEELVESSARLRTTCPPRVTAASC